LPTMQRGAIGGVPWRLIRLADLYSNICRELKRQRNDLPRVRTPMLSTVD
jgi:hypothetical protein